MIGMKNSTRREQIAAEQNARTVLDAVQVAEAEVTKKWSAKVSAAEAEAVLATNKWQRAAKTSASLVKASEVRVRKQEADIWSEKLKVVQSAARRNRKELMQRCAVSQKTTKKLQQELKLLKEHLQAYTDQKL